MKNIQKQTLAEIEQFRTAIEHERIRLRRQVANLTAQDPGTFTQKHTLVAQLAEVERKLRMADELLAEAASYV